MTGKGGNTGEGVFCPGLWFFMSRGGWFLGGWDGGVKGKGEWEVNDREGVREAG